VCLHEFEVLLPQTVNARLKVYLDISHLIGRLNHFVHGHLQVADGVRSFIDYRLFSCLPRQQRVKMLFKFIVCLEPIKDVMSWDEIEEASVNGGLIVQRIFGLDAAIFSFIKHLIQFVKEFLDERRIFITNLADVSRTVAHMEVVEILFVL